MDNDNKKPPQLSNTSLDMKKEKEEAKPPQNEPQTTPQPTFQTTISDKPKISEATTLNVTALKSETPSQVPGSADPISTINGEKLFSSIGKRNRNKWSEKEDQKLTTLVKKYDYKNWKIISQQLPGRSSVQCLHRWTKILQPGLVKGPWTAEEDQKLVDWVRKQGPTKWTLCAEIITGRSGKQCREHWNNSLNPEVKKGDWTSKEDLLIMHFYKKYEGSWKKMIPLFPKRTENSIKNRFFSQLRKIASSDDNLKDKKISAKIKLSTLLNYLDFATKTTKERYMRDNNLKDEEIEEIYKKAEEEANEREKCKLLRKAIRPKKSLFEFERVTDPQENDSFENIKSEMEDKNKENQSTPSMNNINFLTDKDKPSMILNNNITNQITNNINIKNIVRSQPMRPSKESQQMPSFLEYVRPKSIPANQVQPPAVMTNPKINFIPSFNNMAPQMYNPQTFSGNIAPNMPAAYIQPSPYFYHNNYCPGGIIMINNSHDNICVNNNINEDPHFDENFENLKKDFSNISGFSFLNKFDIGNFAEIYAKKPSTTGVNGCSFRENDSFAPPELIPKYKNEQKIINTLTNLNNLEQTLVDRQKKFNL